MARHRRARSNNDLVSFRVTANTKSFAASAAVVTGAIVTAILGAFGATAAANATHPSTPPAQTAPAENHSGHGVHVTVDVDK